MTMLSEDPTFLVGGLVALAGALAIALRVTQQGKYLIWALGALGLAVAVIAVDWFWVTDSERIEQVVNDLRRAVLASDAEGVLSHLTPDVQYVQSGTTMSAAATKALIRANLSSATFDFVQVRQLQTSAGKQTRRGKAEFQVFAKGRLQTPLATLDVGTANSTWSLGFQETAPGVWMVNRITPVSVPEGVLRLPQRTISVPPTNTPTFREEQNLPLPGIEAGPRRRGFRFRGQASPSPARRDAVPHEHGSAVSGPMPPALPSPPPPGH